MGNQQERRSVQLAWLAGVIDGEGTVGVYGGGESCSVYVSIANQDPNLVETAAHIIKALGVGVWVKRYERPIWYVRVQGLKRLKTFLPMIIPYLTSRKQEAELLLAFVEQRLSRFSKTWLADDYALAAKIRSMKTDRILREYTPNPTYVGDDVLPSSVESGS